MHGNIDNNQSYIYTRGKREMRDNIPLKLKNIYIGKQNEPKVFRRQIQA